MIAGKIIGGLIGFYSFGIIGALIGAYTGHMFDRAFHKLRQDDSPEMLQAIQTVFFETSYILIGYLAKADGHISEEEINETQKLMDKMGLTAEHKREAIRLFKIGSKHDFEPTETLAAFQEICGHRTQLKQMLMVYLINTALADGTLDEKEESTLRQVAQGLQFSHLTFEKLLRMIRAQSSFSESDSGYYSNNSSNNHSNYQQSDFKSHQNELDTAYTALGVSKDISDKDLKRAYRKLMSEYHPDKLIGQGVPDDMVKVTTERSQEVQAAYDLIKKSRKSY